MKPYPHTPGSNGYALHGQCYPPRGMPAVGTEFEITGWITPRG